MKEIFEMQKLQNFERNIALFLLFLTLFSRKFSGVPAILHLAGTCTNKKNDYVYMTYSAELKTFYRWERSFEIFLGIENYIFAKVSEVLFKRNMEF